MIGLFSVSALILIHISFISTYPTSHSVLTSIKKRADGCDLFDTDSRCSLSGDDSFPVAIADPGSDLFFGGGGTGSDLLPDDAMTFDVIGSSGSSTQTTSLITDPSTSTLDTDFLGTENLDPNLLSQDIETKSEPDNLLNSLPENSINDPQEDAFLQAERIHFAGELDDSITYICEEVGDECVQYKNKVRVKTRYVRCGENGAICRVCDERNEIGCDILTWPSKEQIPSPDNGWGQDWNHCRNKRCKDPCEAFAFWFPILNLGVIPFCGPPKYQ